MYSQMVRHAVTKQANWMGKDIHYYLIFQITFPWKYRLDAEDVWSEKLSSS